MAQTGYTPISIYYSATATNTPTAGNLVAGELAINTNDGVLYYKDSSGVVQSIASKAGNSGSFTNLAYTGTLTGGTGVVNLGSGQFYKDASGNVGIGTTSPSQKLEVASAAGGTIGLRYIGNSGYATVGTDANNNLLFSIGNPPTERMRIDSSGNFYVGKTAYSDTSGNGFGVFPNSGVPQVSCVGSSNSTNKNFTVYSSTDSAYKFYVDYAGGGYFAGNVNIGITGLSNRLAVYGPEATMLVRCSSIVDVNSKSFVSFQTNAGSQVGSITGNTSVVTYNTSSDYRLKEDIAPMTGALATVSALKPVTYKWKIDGSNGQGFIAHELAEIVPDCVTGEKDAVDAEGNPKYQGIDTSFLVATLTAAIQEQQALIESLTTRLTVLEAK